MSKLSTWFDVPKNSDFSIYNLPFGIFSTATLTPRVGVAIGNHIIDLAGLAALHLIEIDREVLTQSSLNSFIRLGKKKTNGVRMHFCPIGNTSLLLIMVARLLLL